MKETNEIDDSQATVEVRPTQANASNATLFLLLRLMVSTTTTTSPRIIRQPPRHWRGVTRRGEIIQETTTPTRTDGRDGDGPTSSSITPARLSIRHCQHKPVSLVNTQCPHLRRRRVGSNFLPTAATPSGRGRDGNGSPGNQEKRTTHLLYCTCPPLYIYYVKGTLFRPTYYDSRLTQ